jgi:uncharacterized membrane protein YjjP (DUF1212 family)
MLIYALIAVLCALCGAIATTVLRQHFGLDIELNVQVLCVFASSAVGLAIWNAYQVLWIRWKLPNNYATDVIAVAVVVLIPFIPVAKQALA